MDFKVHQFLPNPGYITYKLSNEEMDFVWKKIDQALVDNENANAKLAGNINKSLDMNMEISALLILKFLLFVMNMKNNLVRHIKTKSL